MQFFTVLSVLLICSNVLNVSSSNLHQISDYYFNGNQNSNPIYNLTLICGQIQNNRIFSSNYFLRTKNGYDVSRSSVMKISFEHCDYPDIPNNLSQIFTNFHTLNVSHVGFSSLDQIPFGEAKKLTTLIASYNGIREIPSLSFHKSDKLIEIDVSFNRIHQIDDFALFGDLNLQKLNLSHNQLTTFNDHIVSDHPHLTHLDLSANQINALKTNAFERLRDLMHLDLSGNPIKTVDRNMFLMCVKLQYLNLSRTSLVEIKSGTFSHQINLRILDLSGNRIKMLNSNGFPLQLDHLDLLAVGDNPLREISGFTSSTYSKIVGIQSTEFKCSFLNDTYEPNSWKHLDMIAKRMKCISDNADFDDIDLSESSTAPSNEQSTQRKEVDVSTSKPAIEVTESSKSTKNSEIHRQQEQKQEENRDGKRGEEQKPNQKQNENQMNVTLKAHFEDNKAHTVTDTGKHMLITSWINTILLIIIAMAILYYVFRKRMHQKNQLLNSCLQVSYQDKC